MIPQHFSSRIFSALPIFIGSVSLAAWMSDHQALSHAIPAYANMTFNTALFSTLLGCCLLFASSGRWIKPLSASISLFIMLHVLLTFFQNISGIDIGIDHLLFDSTSFYPDNPHPGRMSPQTLIAFFSASLALLLLSIQSLTLKAATSIHSCIFVTKLLGLYGIAMAILFPSKPMGLVYFSSMSLFTAITFLSISIALRRLFQRFSNDKKHERRLLFPAIRLMLRLSYPKKFLLIGLIFSLPLAVSTWHASSLSNKEISTLNNEIIGLNHAESLLELFSLVQKHRGMMHSFLQNRQLFFAEIPELEYQIQKKIRRISRRIQNMNPALIQTQQWQDIESMWQHIDSTKQSQLASSWEKHTQLIENISKLIHQVGRKSALLYDLDPEINDLSSMLLLDMLHLFEGIGILRGQGTAFFATTKISDKALIFMVKMDSKIAVWLDTIVQTIHRQGREQLLEHMNRDFLPTVQLLHQTIVSIKSSSHTQIQANFFFKISSQALNEGIALYSKTNQFLLDRLNERINQQQTTKYLLESCVVIALMLLFFLFTAFYQSVMMTINALNDKAQRMKQGDFTGSLDLDNQDELGLVVQSFNMVAAELLSAVEEAKQAEHAKSRFLATMSHEIRTPLNGVLGLTELVLNSHLNWEQRQHLQTVHASGKSLLMILNDILDFSKMEADQFSLSKAAFSLNAVIDHVLKLYSPIAQNKGIQLYADSIPEFSTSFIGDADRLQQVLMNFISNAIKFTHTGSVSLQLQQLDESDQHVCLRFSIQDTGIGIKPEDIPKLFVDFSQLDTSHARKFGGTGLGLVITQKILQLMDSQIQVESIEGKGSSFSFELNLSKGAKNLSIEPKPKTSTISSHKRHERILLVEDVQVNQLVAIGLLKNLGFEHIAIAHNGLQAIEMVRKHDFELILMDIQMPEMGGYEATRAIRHLMSQHQPSKQLPIIALTAHAFDDERQECLASGMNDVITKPLTAQHLAKLMNRWLNNDAQHINTSHQDNTQTAINPTAGLDANTLCRLHDDMGCGLEPILEMFIQNLPKQLRDIHIAADMQDWQKLQQLAHRLKGTSSNIGALALQNLCIELESYAISKPQPDTIASLLTALADEEQNILSSLQEPWLQDLR